MGHVGNSQEKSGMMFCDEIGGVFAGVTLLI